MSTFRWLAFAGAACLASSVAHAQGSGTRTTRLYSGPPSLSGYSVGVAPSSANRMNTGVSIYRGVSSYSGYRSYGRSNMSSGANLSQAPGGSSNPFSDFPTVGWTQDSNPFSGFPTVGFSHHSNPFAGFPTVGW